MNNTILTTVFLAIAALSGVASAANLAISTVTINDANGDRTLSATETIELASTLVNFTTGSGGSLLTYQSFNLVTTVSDIGSPANDSGGIFWMQGATGPGSAEAALTDNRIDTSYGFIPISSKFTFASAPIALTDSLFMFDIGGNDPTTQIQLIDSSGTLLGSAVTLSGMANLGVPKYTTDRGNGGTFNVGINGVAVTLDEFGITAGQLSSVDGFIQNGTVSNVDPSLAGIASINAVPEPTTTALLGLGGLALILRRRK